MSAAEDFSQNDASGSFRILDAQTVETVEECIKAAKSRGWTAEDLAQYFARRGVTPDDWRMAGDGFAVSERVAGELAAVSVHDLPCDPPRISEAELPDHPAIMELRQFRQWVAWRYKPRPNDKPTKPPINPHTGFGASHSDPATWGTYEEAVARRLKDSLPGVGFVLAASDDLTGIDLDDCRDEGTGDLEPWAQAIVDLKETYCEISPSGTGLRLISRGKIAAALKYDPAHVEVYGTQRYLTITGQHLAGTPISIEPAPLTIAALEARVAEVKAELAAAKAKARAAADDAEERRHTAGESKSSGPSSFWKNVDSNALAHLDAWVPKLFPGAVFQASTRGYRVSSSHLGRDLQEDLSITPMGIVDWGTHDMGHPNDGKYTPIGLVMEFNGQTVKEAAFWLCERLLVDPAALGWKEANQRDDTDSTWGTAGKAEEPHEVIDLWDDYIVPDFPLEVLPPAIARWVAVHALAIGCDRNGLAMAALANFSAALDHQFSLKMMRKTPWPVSPRLWVILVGDPSRKKTPIITAATRDLDKIQNQLRDEYERALAIYQDEKEAGNKDAVEPVIPPRYVVGDVTVEKLGEILSRYDRGLLIKRDEFSGFIGAMEKYGGGGRGASADRAFWLQAFDGGPFTVDRIQRGETRVRNLSVSFIGGIQPARLAELKGLTSDGLLQRFLPVMLGPSSFPRDEPTDEPLNAYGRLTSTLLRARPASLILADDAHQASEDLRRELHELGQVAGGLAEGFVAFIGKLAGLFGSIILVLHMMRHPEHGNCEAVSRDVVQDAARLVREFVLPHAYEFYRSADTVTDGDRLRKIGSYVLTSGKERILASDFSTNVALLRGASLHDLNKHVSPLVAGGWLEPTEPGLMSRSWRVRAGVRECLEARMRTEENRKQALASLMGAGRKPKGGR